MSIRQVRLFQLPFSGDHLWRDVFSSACEAHGWRYVEYAGGECPAIDESCSALIVGSDRGFVETPAGTDWVVQASTSAEVLSEVALRGGLGRADALYAASIRLAAASELVRDGAMLCSAFDAHIEIPGLGVLPGPVLAQRQLADEPALALYDTLPVNISQPMFWEGGLFSFCSEVKHYSDGVEMALLGRRRLLFNGPHIWIPSGLWQVVASFEVAPENKADLQIEWGYGVETTTFSQVFTKPGRYELKLETVWERAAPADFRISLMMPALAGRMTLHGVTIRLLSAPGSIPPIDAE